MNISIFSRKKSIVYKFSKLWYTNSYFPGTRLLSRIKADSLVVMSSIVGVCVRMFLERRDQCLSRFTRDFTLLTVPDEKEQLVDNFLTQLYSELERDPMWISECLQAGLCSYLWWEIYDLQLFILTGTMNSVTHCLPYIWTTVRYLLGTIMLSFVFNIFLHILVKVLSGFLCIWYLKMILSVLSLCSKIHYMSPISSLYFMVEAIYL